MKPTEVVRMQMEKSRRHHELELRFAEMLEQMGFEITSLSIEEMAGPLFDRQALVIHILSNKGIKAPGNPSRGWPT